MSIPFFDGFIERIMKGTDTLPSIDNFLPEESVNMDDTFYKYTGRKFDLPNPVIKEEPIMIDNPEPAVPFEPRVHYHCLRKESNCVQHYNVWMTEEKFPENPSIGDLLFYRPAISFEEFLIQYAPYDKIIWKAKDAFIFYVGRIGIPMYNIENTKIYIFTEDRYWEKIPMFINTHYERRWNVNIARRA